jgi:6-phospho-beta-glucosidase
MQAFMGEMAAEEGWDLETITALDLIPNYYLQYYYYPDRKLADQQGWPPSRAEQVLAIEKRLMALYAEPGRSSLPEELLERGGAYYSTLATQLIDSHYNDLNRTYVVNIPHRGAVPGWPEDWVLELPCIVGQDGIKPQPTEPLPEVCSGLIAQVKSYELLTVEAAVHGDRQATYQALLAHPLGPDANLVQTVLDDMLRTHKSYLPQFQGTG